MEANFLSKRQAAELLGVTARTVQNWITEGKFPNARLIGNQWAIPEDEVQVAVCYVDVVPVKREIEAADLLNVYIKANQVLLDKIQERDQQLIETIQEQNETIKQLEKKLENFHDEVVTRWIREKQEQEQKKPLIKRLLGI